MGLVVSNYTPEAASELPGGFFKLKSTFKYNYSICNFKNKVFIFGGINDKN